MSDDKLIKELLHQSEVARIMGDIHNARLFKQAAECIARKSRLYNTPSIH